MQRNSIDTNVSSTIESDSHRLHAIDLLRGLVMIIMALDHTRDFIHAEAFTGDPLNLQTTTPTLYFTRWITHFCAPVFVFLSGTSAWLQGMRKTTKELSVFLLKRGLWLIVIEIVLMTLIMSFDPGYSFIILAVIWAIGISMILLGLLIWLPLPVILSIGLLIVFGHNLLGVWASAQAGPLPAAYQFLHRPGIIPMGNGHLLGNFYPFLAWTGVMLLGYCFGKVYTVVRDVKNQTKIIAITGFALILLFLVLRSINLYGDPLLWSNQKSGLYTFLSFINTQKYPPSLLFLCMTLGPSLIFLAYAGNIRNWFTKIISVYGKVPLSYYVLHFFIIHTVSAALYLQRGHSFAEGATGLPGLPFKFILPGEGYSLGVVYLIWIAVVIAFYPFCKWFSEYKRRHSKWWLSYL